MEEMKDILREIRDGQAQARQVAEDVARKLSRETPAWKGYLVTVGLAIAPALGLGLIAWGGLTNQQRLNIEKINEIDKHLASTDTEVSANRRSIDATVFKADRAQGDLDRTMALVMKLNQEMQDMHLAMADFGRMRTDLQAATQSRTEQMNDLNNQLGAVVRGLEGNNLATGLLAERLETMRQQMVQLLGAVVPNTPILPPATPPMPPKRFNLPR